MSLRELSCEVTSREAAATGGGGGEPWRLARPTETKCGVHALETDQAKVVRHTRLSRLHAKRYAQIEVLLSPRNRLQVRNGKVQLRRFLDLGHRIRDVLDLSESANGLAVRADQLNQVALPGVIPRLDIVGSKNEGRIAIVSDPSRVKGQRHGVTNERVPVEQPRVVSEVQRARRDEYPVLVGHGDLPLL